MIRIEIVKGAHSTEATEYSDTYKNGTAVSLRLTKPWHGSGRGVYADSFFASVECCEALMCDAGLYFTGPIKQNTARYPHAVLKDQIIEGQGSYISMTSTSVKKVELTAVLHCDRNRKEFVSSQGTSLLAPPSKRKRLVNSSRLVDEGLKEVTVEISQPDILWGYYLFNDQVDRHNRRRQDDLNIEKKFEVKEWDFRVVSSILGVIVTNAYLLYRHSRRTVTGCLSQKKFVALLGGEMIKNDIDVSIASRKPARSVVQSKISIKVAPEEEFPHLKVTKDIRIQAKGPRPHRKTCMVCRKGSRVHNVCWKCPHFYICGKMNHKCFSTHIKDAHSDLVINLTE